MRQRKSSKPVAIWTGNDSQGSRVEVALSDNGKYYARVAQYNGYSVAFDAWSVHEPSFNKAGAMEWGFNLLRKFSDVSDIKYRLPL